MGLFGKSKPVTKRMDESIVPDEILKLEEGLTNRVAGQERAIKQFVRVHETVLSGLLPTNKPIQNLLFVGPTGSGKTHVVEVFCDILNITLIKVDCAEFQQSHEIAKLLGAPPGYVGQEVQPVITKERVEEKWEGSNPRYTVILFDEIEKAHPAFHQILLGALDRGYFTTGKNKRIDLTKCAFVMTSNLGSGEVKKALNREGYGFSRPSDASGVDEDIYQISKRAVTAFFSPEFFNRIDRMIVFRSLTDTVLRQILEMELKIVQDRVLKANQFVHVDLSERGKEFLLQEGTSREFGARHLRRAIERFLVSKLTRAFATKQAEPGDMILADKEPETKGLVLDIMKAVMEVPRKELPIVKYSTQQPKAVRIEPSNPSAKWQFQDSANPEHCGRCGFRWYDKHVCADLVRDSDRTPCTGRPCTCNINRRKPR